MPTSTITTSAPAKLILCGEHAVVYGCPAIAVPLEGIRAHVELGDSAGAGAVIDARDLGRRWAVADEPADPLSALTIDMLSHFGLGPDQGLLIAVRSDIPIASGMGSGAAVATALVRALALRAGQELSAGQISDLVYESERRLHGTPSGIDNTVIAFERPIWFVRRSVPQRGAEDPEPAAGGQEPLIEPVEIGAPLRLLVGDTGVRSATHEPVGAVRRGWRADPDRFEALFGQVAALAALVRAALGAGDAAALGPLLDRNHTLLQEIGVSSPELDRLVLAARDAGALGAKLSGAGWGGVMLALVTETSGPSVAAALRAAGATSVLETPVASRT